MRLKYIVEDVDRHGNKRVYFWRGRNAAKIRLRSDPGTVAFMNEYAAALAAAAVKADERARRDEDGPAFVYIAREARGRHCKIGISGKIGGRVAGLQTGNPRAIVMKKVFQVNDTASARAIERAAHDILAAARASGEWFACTIARAAAAVETAAAACDIELWRCNPRRPEAAPAPRWIGRAAAAARFGISCRQFADMVEAGWAPTAKRIGSKRVWDAAAIERALTDIHTFSAINPFDAMIGPGASA